MERRVTSKIVLTLLAIGIVFLPSCRRVENVVYADFEDFGSMGWDPARLLPFVPWPMDSIVTPEDRFELVLTVRYSPSIQTSIIPLEITEENADSVFATTRVNLKIRDENGELKGRKGISLYEYSDTIRSSFSIPDGYQVELQSLAAMEDSYGLRSIGFTLIKSESTR